MAAKQLARSLLFSYTLWSSHHSSNPRLGWFGHTRGISVTLVGSIRSEYAQLISPVVLEPPSFLSWDAISIGHNIVWEDGILSCDAAHHGVSVGLKCNVCTSFLLCLLYNNMVLGVWLVLVHSLSTIVDNLKPLSNIHDTMRIDVPEWWKKCVLQ